MRFSNRLPVLQYIFLDDGYGGFTKTIATIDTINCRIDEIDNNYSYLQFGKYINDGIVVYSLTDLDINTNELFFNYNNKTYKIIKAKHTKNQFSYIGEYQIAS